MYVTSQYMCCVYEAGPPPSAASSVAGINESVVRVLSREGAGSSSCIGAATDDAIGAGAGENEVICNYKYNFVFI